MTVTGNGEVLAVPDIMMIQFEVQTENESLAQAQQENINKMNAVIDTLVQSGIQREDIQTTGLTIFPVYDFADGEQIFRGYQVTNSIMVKLTNIDRAGYVIDAAVGSGANRVSNLQFSAEDSDRLYLTALNQALKDAVEKAETIAKSFQLHLDIVPVKIIEQMNETSARPKTFAASEFSTPIEPGQISISAMVKVIFQY